MTTRALGPESILMATRVGAHVVIDVLALVGIHIASQVVMLRLSL